MSKKTLENVKKDKGFKIFDLIVYGVIILIIAVSFIAVFSTKNKTSLTGISVYFEDEVIFSYDFENDRYQAAEGYTVEVDDKGESLQVKITTGLGYNLILIEKSGSVRIKDADCRGGDCAYSPAITDGSGIIYCSPHRLKIVPSDYDDSKVTI